MTPLSLAYAGARTQIPDAPLPVADHGAHLAGASSRFLCLSFFAAAKKVSAAPHRGNTNRPLTMQGKAPKPEQGQSPKNTNKKRRAGKKNLNPEPRLEASNDSTPPARQKPSPQH